MGPRGGNVISTEGKARALHFSPAPTGPEVFTPLGLPSGKFSRHSSDVGWASGLFYVSPYFYILDIHQLVMKKIATLLETTRDHAATVKSGSAVFSVPQQQQRAVSTAEEFCVQIHAIKLAIKPQQK